MFFVVRNFVQHTLSLGNLFYSSTDSPELSQERDSLLFWLIDIDNYYHSEEYIQAGNALAYNQQYQSDKANLFEEKYPTLLMLYSTFPAVNETDSTNDTTPGIHLPPLASGTMAADSYVLWQIFEQKYAAEIAVLSAESISRDLNAYRGIIYNLNRYISASGALYVLETPDNLLTNAPDTSHAFFESFRYYYRQDMGNGTILLAWPDSYVDAKMLAWTNERAHLLGFLRQFSLLLGAILLLLGLLVWGTGSLRSAAAPDAGYRLSDHIYLEIIVALALAGLLGIAIVTDIWSNNPFNLAYYWMAAAVAATLGACLIILKHLKERTFLRNTLIGSILGQVFQAILKIYQGGSLMHKAVVAVLIFGLITMIPLTGVITIPLAMWLIYRQVKDAQVVLAGAQAIRDGDYTSRIDPPRPGELRQLADNLNQIAAGLNEEVKRRTKSERMKSELISNVSHDLRTPLTSVITYVDLLQQSNLPDEQVQGYVSIIAQKSGRLKTLIDDLFEITKITTGSQPLELTTLDLNALLQQALGELNEKILAAELDFKLTVPDDKVLVLADGKQFWRVLENVFSNVLKYALPRSRVYLNLYHEGNDVRLDIKNISAYELNIDEQELMERFTRGDASRHSEGSGLGLNIAKSLMNVQYGTLDITIDGDLFKVSLRIPAAE
jgi:signal transduction histidine kinase